MVWRAPCADAFDVLQQAAQIGRGRMQFDGVVRDRHQRGRLRGTQPACRGMKVDGVSRAVDQGKGFAQLPQRAWAERGHQGNAIGRQHARAFRQRPPGIAPLYCQAGPDQGEAVAGERQVLEVAAHRQKRSAISALPQTRDVVASAGVAAMGGGAGRRMALPGVGEHGWRKVERNARGGRAQAIQLREAESGAAAGIEDQGAGSQGRLQLQPHREGAKPGADLALDVGRVVVVCGRAIEGVANVLAASAWVHGRDGGRGVCRRGRI